VPTVFVLSDWWFVQPDDFALPRRSRELNRLLVEFGRCFSWPLCLLYLPWKPADDIAVVCVPLERAENGYVARKRLRRVLSPFVRLTASEVPLVLLAFESVNES